MPLVNSLQTNTLSMIGSYFVDDDSEDDWFRLLAHKIATMMEFDVLHHFSRLYYLSEASQRDFNHG
nr:MAG TPA: hypothetical protein [Caudoviricetes sp.]